MADEAKKKAKAAERERASAIAEGKWVPAPADKSKAVWFRVAAIVLWVAAIAIELWVIFKILLPDDKEVVTWQILVFLAAMAVLAIAGNLLWRKANRLDPASEQNKFRFFVQNQLGAIITVIAFLPLIILVFLDKDMDGKQKGIIGGIAIAIAAAVFATGVETNPVSQEQITRERNVVQALAQAPLPPAAWQALGRAIRQLHDHQVFHSDLNAHNLLIDDQQHAWVIDFDKCGLRCGNEWKAANLQRLLRSLRKEQQRCAPFHWDESQWPLLLAGYEAGAATTPPPLSHNGPAG